MKLNKLPIKRGTERMDGRALWSVRYYPIVDLLVIRKSDGVSFHRLQLIKAQHCRAEGFFDWRVGQREEEKGLEELGSAKKKELVRKE
ncbi:hypothetical protein J6590_027177 [Homalodisca vitripennis]|nr:hypothetical protein J6590_027177 [Homalodisca vitripennis]